MRFPLALVLVLGACACPHVPAQPDPRPADPPDPRALELAASGVELAAWTLHVSADLAADDGNAPACATLEAFAGLGHAVAESLIGEASGRVTIGELAVDASACGDLALATVDVPDLVGEGAERLIQAVRFQIRAFRLTCEEAARVDAALAYLQGATGPIVAALEAGQLTFTIPAFSAEPPSCGG